MKKNDKDDLARLTALSLMGEEKFCKAHGWEWEDITRPKARKWLRGEMKMPVEFPPGWGMTDTTVPPSAEVRKEDDGSYVVVVNARKRKYPNKL